MAKSDITLPDGTKIKIDGSPEEIARIISLYGRTNQVTSRTAKKSVSSRSQKNPQAQEKKDELIADVLSLVNAAKNSDDFEQMEKMVLDKSSQVDRVLLPLLIAEREFPEKYTLSSGDIYEFLKQFGVNMALPNVSKTLGKAAQKYVIANKARKKGGDVRYVISRPGKKYMEQIIES